jgi:hypothetical protein
VEWQSFAFVDDFVVRVDEQRSFDGYQLKNAKDVSWTAGDPSIENDFATQRRVCEAEGYSRIRLGLVCSDPKVASDLRAAVPAPIAAFSQATFFPYQSSLRELLAEHEEIAADFGYLHKKDAPTRMEVDQLTHVLIGAWTGLAPRALVSEVWSKARDMSPTLLRTMRTDEEAARQLSQEFREALARVPKFEYAILKGFLHWSAIGGSTTGVLSYDCFSDRFRDFQQHIVRLQPKSFDDIEGALV